MTSLASAWSSHRSAAPSATLSAIPEDGCSDAGRILVIDDDQRMCEALGTALSRRGFVVAWCTLGREAIDLLEQREFDVVLTDLEMDGINGLAICEHVAKAHPGLPVVVLTAFGTLETEASARSAGAFGFLPKPFDLELLRTTLSQSVLHRRATKG